MQTLITGLVIVGASVGVALAGLLITRRLISPVFEAQNQTAGSVFSVLGTIYGVLLAFVAIIVWQQFDDATGNVTREANAVRDMSRLTEGFPEAFRNEANALLTEYIRAVIDEEWDQLAHGGESAHAREVVAQIWTMYAGYQPRGNEQSAVYASSLQQLSAFSDYRRQRLHDSRTVLPSVIWVALVGAGLIVVSFTYFFELRSLMSHALMTASLAAVIAFLLFLIYALDNPFRGDVRIAPDSFEVGLSGFTPVTRR